MAESKPESKSDPELDALLDSAAKDFEKPTTSVTANETKAEPSVGGLEDLQRLGLGNLDPMMFFKEDGCTLDEAKWAKFEEEQQKKASVLMAKAEEEMASSEIGRNLVKSIQEGFAKAAQEEGVSADEIAERLKSLKMLGVGEGMDPSREKEFTDAVAGAMQSLKENLSEAFPQMKPGEGEDGEQGNIEGELENLGSVMQQMMLALLSKEMLLPSFKEMSEKYPAWLEENKSKLDEADLKRYTSQLEVVKLIVEELEKEGSHEEKQHLDRMVELMQKMQDLGQPPKELTAQLGNTLDDSKVDALLKDSGADQCSVM